MRLMKYSAGAFTPVFFGTRGHISASTFESEMGKFTDANGKISSLCVDFCGQYLPLLHREDIRITAQLLASYYNDDVNAQTQVLPVEKSVCYK